MDQREERLLHSSSEPVKCGRGDGVLTPSLVGSCNYYELPRDLLSSGVICIAR